MRPSFQTFGRSALSGGEMGLLDRSAAVEDGSMRPPETLTTTLVSLHRCTLDDVTGLDAAITASRPELARFMAWATDEHGEAETRAYLERSINEWDSGEAFNYVMVAPDGVVVGSSGLMTRMGPGILEIGYWVHSAYAGQGIATAAAGALAEAGARLEGITTLAIKHDVDNPASGRVAEKLGFARAREERRELTAAKEDSGADLVWERAAHRA
jgi:RimJ/RimL family protein N-acetyltransferase